MQNDINFDGCFGDIFSFTEVMWVGHQREELNIRLDGYEIKQVDGFVYLGGYGGWAFRGRSATSDTSGSECLEKGRGSHVGQKNFEKAERESPENVWKKDERPEERGRDAMQPNRKIGEKQDEMATW